MLFLAVDPNLTYNDEDQDNVGCSCYSKNFFWENKSYFQFTYLLFFKLFSDKIKHFYTDIKATMKRIVTRLTALE